MFGHWEVIIVLVIVLVIFGAGKLPGVMGDLGKGIGAFKKGMAAKDDEEKETPKKVAAKKTTATAKKTVAKKKTPTKKKTTTKKTKK
jgi:sec-independent protein translocase protein TatA